MTIESEKNHTRRWLGRTPHLRAIWKRLCSNVYVTRNLDDCRPTTARRCSPSNDACCRVGSSAGDNVMAISACKIGHVTFATPDVRRLAEHYTDIVGLAVSAEEKDQVVLSTSLGEEALVLVKAAVPGLTHLSLQLSPNSSTEEVVRHLRELGLSAEVKSDVTPGITRLVEFEDPAGRVVQLFTESRLCEPKQAPHGVVPLKLGHVAFMVPSALGMVEFYTRVLGFKVSDWLLNTFAFLRCGPDHHTVNFMSGDENRLHHVAFELKDWSHIQSACDYLGRRKKKIIWGPGRHGIGHNIFIYYRDDDDNIVEFYTELDQMKSEALGYFEPRPWHQDFPQRPKVWERLPAGLTWGTPPTEDFLRSHFQKTYTA